MIPTRRFFPLLLISGLACVPNAGAQPAAPGAASQRIYVVTHIDVLPDYAAKTGKLLQQYAADSRKDAGIVRFEVMVQDGRPNHFTIVEVWRSRAAFEAHTALDHTKRYREQLFPFLGSPYDERLHALVP
jgi:quinol monooxygenase YgiN